MLAKGCYLGIYYESDLLEWKSKLFLTEIIILLMRQNTIPYGQGIINAFDHMELCLVINLTRPPVLATR